MDEIDDTISSKLDWEQGGATAGTSSIGCSKGAERVHGKNGDALLIALSDLSVQGWVIFFEEDCATSQRSLPSALPSNS